MDVTLRDLLDLTTWRAFDVDAEGRVLAGSDATGTVQLVEIDTDGTRRELTALPGACSGRYLPDSRTVIVSHDTGGNERAQLSLLDLESTTLPSTVDGLTELVADERYIHDLEEVVAGRVAYRTNRRNGVDFDVVIRNVATGEEEVLYADGGWVGSVAVSAQSRYVAMTRPATKAMSDQLLLVDTMPATPDEHVRAITDADEAGQIGTPAWLGDSDSLVMATDLGREFTGIARYDVDSGEWTWLVTEENADLSVWPSPDGSLLLIMANLDGLSRFTLHTAAGEHVRDVRLPSSGWTGFPLPAPTWSADSRYVAITFSSAAVPGDVLRIDVATGEVSTVVSSAEPLKGAQLSVPTSARVPGDGGDIPCFVYAPTVSVPAMAGAAVMLIHGGPESQSTRFFSPVVQGLAGAGLTVLVPNVRGSTGYGKSWYSADDVRQRMNSVADLAALHRNLGALGLDRAALWGGSYGGYMVLAGLAFQPSLWATGVDIVGMSSLVTFLENTSEYRRAQREREYGSLAEDRDFLVSASPLTKIDDMAAPLFVIHGANDPRVPLSEAEQLRDALAARDIECELVVYADEGHGLAKRANRLNAYPRAVDFLTRQLARK